MDTENGNGYSASLITNGIIGGGGVFNYTRDMLCTGTIIGGTDPNWHYLAGPIDGFTTHDHVRLLCKCMGSANRYMDSM